MSNNNENNKAEIVKCPHCGKDVAYIEGTTQECPYCKQSIPEAAEDISKPKKIFRFLTTRKKLGVLSIILFVLLFSTAGSMNADKAEKEQLISQLSEAELQIDALNNQCNELQSSFDELQNTYNNNEKELTDLRNQIGEYQDQQATINDLNAKVTELQSQYDALQADRDNLQVQVDAKKAAEEQAARQSAEQALAQQQQQQSSGGIVYWVSGGEVYHSTPNCVTLKRSSNIQSGTIAQSGKARACKVCY